MSDQSSHATAPSESDFHDSHPLSDAEEIKSTPPLGDLTSIETNIADAESKIHSVGDISQIQEQNTSQPHSDISLLDEAVAEMSSETAIADDDIPVLSDAITTPNESKIVELSNDNATIPTLDQEATVFAEMLKPATKSANSEFMNTSNSPQTDAIQNVEDQLSVETKVTTFESDDASNEEEPLFESAEAQSNSNVNELNSSLEIAAEMMSEASTPGPSQIDSANENADDSTSHSIDIPDFSEHMSTTDDQALEALLDDHDVTAPEYNDSKIDSSISNLSLDIESEIPMSVDATNEENATVSGTEVEINEVPLTSDSQPTEFPADLADDLNSSTVTSDFSHDDHTLNAHTEISAFDPNEDLDSASVTHSTLSIGVAGQENQHEKNQYNLTIPFELHSQLSKKIDELVIDATSSITDELHTQLTARLDDLLSNAVESVLPNLVNNMANELRGEVNQRVKQQLPTIINGVLNKTRLPNQQ